MNDADINFYFDPLCPFAWMTSKWVRQVAAQRDYTVDWRFISLRMLNADVDYDRRFPAGYDVGHTDRTLRSHSGRREAVPQDALLLDLDQGLVQVADVDWIEGLGDYAGLHVGGKTHLIREPLTSLETRLDRTQFVRVHRSTIVQVERIVRVEPSANRDAVLTLRDGKTLRVSRTYRSRLDELLHSPW